MLYSFADAVQLPARAFDASARLFLLRPIHLRQRGIKSSAHSLQQRDRHIEIALHLRCGRVRFNLQEPLRLQIEFGLLQNAFAHHTRTFAPGRIKLRGLPGAAVTLHQYRRHSFAIPGADTRHRRQKLHRHLCGKFAGPHLLLNRGWQ
jgi:hypothetical protein